MFPACPRERRAAADLLEGLDERQPATASLCAGWDVRTAAAYLTAALAFYLLPLLAALVRHAGNGHRANDAVAQQTARRPVADRVAMLRRRR